MRGTEEAVQNRDEKKIKKLGSSSDVSEIKLKGSRRIQVESPKQESIKNTIKDNVIKVKILNKPQTPVLEEEKRTIEVQEEQGNIKPLVIEKNAVEDTKTKEPKKIKKQRNTHKKINNKNSFSGKFFDFFERPRIYKGVYITLITISVFMIAVAVFVIRPIFNNKGVPKLVTVVCNFEKTTKNNYDGEYVFKNGADQVYVNLTDVSSHISLMAIGDGKTMRFYKDDGTYMSVENDSRYIVINGIEIILPSPVIFDGKEVFVPAEILQYYTSGISLEYNVHRQRLTLSYVKTKTQSGTVSSEYEEFRFLPLLPEPIDPILEPEN